MNLLRIAERTLSDGTLAPLTMRGSGDGVAIYMQDTHIGTLPCEALVAVMERFGKPLSADIEAPAPALVLPSGERVSILRHRGFYDVIARDWLVLERAGHETLAELAVSAAAAIEHLARAYARAET